jgi:hypothetical protein
MKKVLLYLILFVTPIAFSQVKGINYQAVIYNSNGGIVPGVNNPTNPLVNKNICLQFTIIDASYQIEYQEIVSTTTDEYGMVNLVIGFGNQSDGYATSFADVYWNVQQKSLKVGVDLNSYYCLNFVEISDQLFSSVPFALSAVNAENVTGVVSIENGGTNATTVDGALITETVAALKETPAFVYLYVNDLDVAGHSDGVGSDQWLAALSGIDQLVATLLQKLPRQTRLWLTADHGMINVGEKIVIGQGNNLAENIATIAGEPRARHLYLSDGAGASEIADVASRWEEFLGEKASIYTRNQAIAAELFGNLVSADAADRMGDVIAIAHGDLILIEAEREKQEGAMVGHHGGASDIESYVPLLTAVIS